MQSSWPRKGNRKRSKGGKVQILKKAVAGINTRDDEESVGEMHMKDYIDVSNQENVAPVDFQSLSLD